MTQIISVNPSTICKQPVGEDATTQLTVCQLMPGRYISRLRGKSFPEDFEWPEGQIYLDTVDAIGEAACEVARNTPAGLP